MILQHDLIAFPAVALGTFFEGEVTILTATVLSAVGSFHTWTVFLAAILGTFACDQLVYWLGRSLRSPESLRFMGRSLVSPAIAGRARHFFGKHGVKTVFLLRYATGIKTAGFFLAGASRMPVWRFMLADLLGTLTWVSVLVLLGLSVGKPVLYFLQGPGGVIVALLVCLIIVLILARFQRRLKLDS